MTDVEKARQEIESLRGIVSELLGPVSDNGAVSQLGAKALKHAREKLRTLEQETRFTREEQQYLVNEWRKLVEETERATDDLAAARGEFVQLLRGGLPHGIRDLRGRDRVIAQLHRRGLQQQAAPFRAWIPEPCQIRTGARPADGQSGGLNCVHSQGCTPSRLTGFDPQQTTDVQCNRLPGCRTTGVPADLSGILRGG